MTAFLSDTEVVMEGIFWNTHICTVIASNSFIVFMWLFNACVSCGEQEKNRGNSSGVIWCMWKGTDIILLPENLGWDTYICSHILGQEENTTCPLSIIQDYSESVLTLILQNCQPYAKWNTALLTDKNGFQNNGFILSSLVQTILRQVKLFLPSDNCGNNLFLFHAVSEVLKWVSCFCFISCHCTSIIFSLRSGVMCRSSATTWTGQF
jgi:hypothetical protein